MTCYGWLAIGGAHAFGATPALNGQSGYINMPNASVEQDGTLSLGYSDDRPYGQFWIASTILPMLQVTARYVSISGIPGFTSDPNGYGYAYGKYKDKVFDGKLRLWQESDWLPSLAIGMTDAQGTRLFRGGYVVATKTFGSHKNLEGSIGYGTQRPDGAFAGMRWTPQALPHWSLVAEYDANNYQKDFRAAETFAGQRRKGPAVGIEYRWGWLGLQAARHQDHSSFNAFVSIPLAEREYIPKIYEPAYYQSKEGAPRYSIAQWQQDPTLARDLVDELERQDYKNIRVEIRGHALHMTLTNSRITNLGRAVGRATRVALALGPEDMRAIHVTYTRLEQPIATYEFFDLPALGDYLSGQTSRKAFLPKVLVRYAGREDIIESDQQGMLVGVRDGAGLQVFAGRDGDVVQIVSEDREYNRFKVVPKLGFFFNDPSGALRYELTAASDYAKRLGTGLYFNGAMGLTLSENVSGVTQKSNSRLPHVRSDVAEYKDEGPLKLYRALLNKYAMPADRWYTRVSAGLYEEMYRGVGGQALYLPKDSRWAVDVAVDALQQRDFKGWFGKRDYNTVTAIGSLHYRLSHGITVTARAGRFLARDMGVRGEFKRRFASGIEVGGWYTVTDGNDITSPGSPSSPYHDKGIFISIPLSSMLPSDTQASAGFSISPWTRDVGQMVGSPGDLYDMLEGPRRDMTTFDGLGNFAERPDEVNHPAVNPPPDNYRVPWDAFRLRLQQSTSAAPAMPDAVKGIALAAGSVFLASRLDNRIDRFVKGHSDSSVLHGLENFGKAAPLAMLGVAGAAIAFGNDEVRNTGLIALQSALAAAGTSMAAKYAVGRARPLQEQGPFAKSSSRSNSSFPSNHTAITFGAITPFAQAYGAPWLYGIGVLGGVGRVASRDHWFSDNVASGLIGYALGSWLWQAQRDPGKGNFFVGTGSDAVSVTWQKSY